MLRNTRESWGGVAKTLHWSAAAVVFVMLGLGLTVVHGDLGAGAKFEAYQLHKSTGFLVLAVMPNLTGPNALLEARTKFVHEVVSKLLIAAIGLHVAAALKHHFADKDTVLRRMLPFHHDDKRP